MGFHERTNYLNKDIDYMIAQEIIEYDMKSAGYNLAKYFKLLPKETLDYLETLPKKPRQIALGVIQRDNKEFNKALSQAFKDGRKLFYDANGLDEDNILSVKKDAIFTTKVCHNTEFDNLIFDIKNIYTSYYYFDKYEFYYNSKGIDVKGIADDTLELHADYMLGVLFDYMMMNETAKRERTISFVKDFSHYYKNLLLETPYYREMNVDSMYRTKLIHMGQQVALKDTDEKDILLTNYNFNTYLIPMIQILV